MIFDWCCMYALSEQPKIDPDLQSDSYTKCRFECTCWWCRYVVCGMPLYVANVVLWSTRTKMIYMWYVVWDVCILFAAACRYEKGAWSDCNAQSEMTRNDKLKANSDPSCEQNRQITKKCKAKGAKPTKGNYRNDVIYQPNDCSRSGGNTKLTFRISTTSIWVWNGTYSLCYFKKIIV